MLRKVIYVTVRPNRIAQENERTCSVKVAPRSSILGAIRSVALRRAKPSCSLRELQLDRIDRIGVAPLGVVERGEPEVVAGAQLVGLHVGLAAGDQLAARDSGSLFIGFRNRKPINAHIVGSAVAELDAGQMV